MHKFCACLKNFLYFSKKKNEIVLKCLPFNKYWKFFCSVFRQRACLHTWFCGWVSVWKSVQTKKFDLSLSSFRYARCHMQPCRACYISLSTTFVIDFICLTNIICNNVFNKYSWIYSFHLCSTVTVLYFYNCIQG